MKKLVAILAGVVAVLFGASIAIAQGASDDAPTDVPTAAHECPHGPDGVHGDCVSAVAEAQDLEDADESEAEDTDDAEAPDEETDEAATEHPDNHGADVSEAAHDCPVGPGGVHGECVSAVAHQDGDESQAEDDDDSGPGNSGEHGNGNGNGNGNGGGQGHGHDG